MSNNDQSNFIADVPYRQLIELLMYLAICTRPDVMFIVNNLNQFLEQPLRRRWKAAKRVLKYLKGTRLWHQIWFN